MSAASPFINAIIATEFFSFLICLILLMGSRLESDGSSSRTRWFTFLVLANAAGCFCDGVSWILDGRPEMNTVLYITTLCSMVLTMVMVGGFISYLSEYVRERENISNMPEMFSWILVAVGIAATIITSFTGDMFTFRNGVFTEGRFYTLYVIANTFYMLNGVVVITVYRKALNRYDKLASYAYMFFPTAAAAFSLVADGCDFAYPAITTSLLIIYIMIQSDRVKKLEKEGTLISYKAAHDELTGLYNRSAYRSRLQAMQTKEENCGVVFGDLNGLKVTNDRYGHKAGDRMLVRYAEILAGMFRMNEIYRISGDEFICIMENAPEEAFRMRVSELEKLLNQEEPPLASVGAAYGRSKEADVLIKEAEARMYAAKEIVHARYPETRR